MRQSAGCGEIDEPEILGKFDPGNLAGSQDPAPWLLLAQGYHGIYIAGPPGWDDCGSECHNS